MNKIHICITVLICCIFTMHVSLGQTGIISTIAGSTSGTSGFSGDGGPAANALLSDPSGVICDQVGNIYFCNSMMSVRKISTTGIITRFAGDSTTYGFSGDGSAATAAKLDFPKGLVFDKNNNLYIFDAYNNRIRKVDTNGIITTIAGGGGTRGVGIPATSALLTASDGVFDKNGNLIFYDQQTFTIKMMDTTGMLRMITANDTFGFSGDGGPASSAKLGNLWPSLTVDKIGNIYLYDGANFRIRKIDTNGIINTIAGTGIAGYSGDGGPSASAQLGGGYGYTMLFDTLNNDLYFTDVHNDVIRKIDQFGIISTFAGTGANGYSGDGGDPLLAKFCGPSFCFDNSGNMIIADVCNNVIRKIRLTPDLHCDSINSYITELCNGINITTDCAHPGSGVYIVTYYGDGTHDSTNLTSGSTLISHNYFYSGTYTIKQILFYSGTVIDSASDSYHHHRCSTFDLSVYHEDSTGCEPGVGEYLVTLPVRVAVDSNGIAIDTVSFTGRMLYYENGTPGDIYEYKIVTMPAGSHAFCPSTGVFQDSIQAGIFRSSPVFQAVKCDSVTNVDLATRVVVYGTGSHEQQGAIYYYNNKCTPASAQLKLSFDSRYNISAAYPWPASTGSGYATWNFSNISSLDSAFGVVNYSLEISGTHLVPGETVTSQAEITTTSTDIDTSNNTYTRIDTSRNGFDPNEVMVSPGCLSIAANPQSLEYTIHFENTGNDTAKNIYVLDTLSDKVDPASLTIVLSSQNMTVSHRNDGLGHHIFRFDFAHINLLDSSHHHQCDGTLIYTINTQAGLPIGADIPNRAGIYFDDNEVVMTNTAHTGVGCPVVNSIPAISNVNSIELHPNPAFDILNIKTYPGAFNNYYISNSIGTVVMASTISGPDMQVNIKALAPGAYYIRLLGDNGVEVRKWVKM